MLTGPLVLDPPFPVPGLVWRETAFTVTDATVISCDRDPLGPMQMVLPSDLAQAVAKRRCEFLAGRLCAALALRAAGFPSEVGRNGRAPVWPAGVIGSISHCNGLAIAAVSTRARQFGLDAEPVMPDARAVELGGALVTEDETALASSGGLTRAGFITLAFSAKEALYKALSPMLERIPGFLEARVSALGPDRLVIDFDGRSWSVLWQIDNGLCRTLAVDPA